MHRDHQPRLRAQRGPDGLIDVAQADAILASRRSMVSDLVMATNAARKQRQGATTSAKSAHAPDSSEKPCGEITAGFADDDDMPCVDPVFADAMLAQQPALDRDYGRPGLTAIQRALEESELRTAHAQNAILARTAAQLREVVGGDVAKDKRHRALLGELYGRLRALLDTERDALGRDLGFIARTPGATRQ